MRLLRQNLSLVAGDCHLATSLSRSLEVAKQSSSVYRGRVPFFTVWGFVNFEEACCYSRRWFLQTMVQDVPADDVTLTNRWPGTWRILVYLQHGLLFRHLRSLRRLEWALLVQRRPKGVLLADYSSRQESHTSTQKSRQRSDSPPRKRRSGDSPHPTRVAKGVILLPARGDLETLLTPQESPREWFSSPQEAIWRLSSAFLGLLVSPGYSPRSFSDYSSRQVTLLRVSRTTRLARGLSSVFLGLLVSPGES